MIQYHQCWVYAAFWGKNIPEQGVINKGSIQTTVKAQIFARESTFWKVCR